VGYNKVLVTLDGSKLAELALQHIIKVVEAGAEIHLLSVMAEGRTSEVASLASAIAEPLTMPKSAWPPLSGAPDAQAVSAREMYLKQVADWMGQLGYEVTTDVRPGNIVETIVSVAREGFDVIVIVTHGRTGIKKVALGSIAEGVLHRAPCPMLIIPASAVNAE
jgi:nucleotide-binding universal stress UspA family protein